MNILADKLKITGKLRRNFGAIIVIAFSASVIYGLPFFRFDYYEAYMNTYHLTNTQMGVFGTIIGVFSIVSYLFGGVIADGLPVKKIIMFSLMGTGAGGLLHLLPLGFGGLVFVYSLWGVSTTFAFWPACVKAVRMMTDEDSQGKGYGYFEGMMNVGSAFTALAAVILFQIGVSMMHNDVLAMKFVIIFYTFINFAMAVYTYFSIKDDEMKFSADRISFKGFRTVIKNPAVWIIALVSFCNHIFCLSIAYYIPYMTDILGAAVAFGAALGVIRKFGSIGGSIMGGYLTDKFGTGRVMFIAFAVMLTGQIIFLFTPAKSSSIYLVAALFVIILIFFSMNYAMAWAMMSEGAVPVEHSGTAAGIICTMGAVPETFISLLAGNIIDRHPGVAGYRHFFYFLTGILVFGILLMIVWRFYIKSVKKKEQKAELQA